MWDLSLEQSVAVLSRQFSRNAEEDFYNFSEYFVLQYVRLTTSLYSISILSLKIYYVECALFLILPIFLLLTVPVLRKVPLPSACDLPPVQSWLRSSSSRLTAVLLELYTPLPEETCWYCSSKERNNHFMCITLSKMQLLY